jgi:hypothetical protein
MNNLIVVTHRGQFEGIYSRALCRWLLDDEHDLHDTHFDGELTEKVKFGKKEAK